MSTLEGYQKLPADILVYLMQFIVPSSAPNSIALPCRHPITRTLLALTLTSRLLSSIASRLLYSHCLYIHNPGCLSKLLRTLSDQNDETKLSTVGQHVIPHIKSIYLRPFHPYMLEEIDIATSVQRLLRIIGPNLRRLLLDMPLRNLRPEDDYRGVRPILCSAFKNLPVLEEFCSVRDELFLNILQFPLFETPVWSMWPRLKTLVLYNQDVADLDFWAGLRELENIDTLVLTRSDGLDKVDIKREWRRLFHEPGNERKMDVYLVNVENEHCLPRGRDGWLEDDKMQVKELNVPTSYYGDDDFIALCQYWVKMRVLNGVAVSEW